MGSLRGRIAGLSPEEPQQLATSLSAGAAQSAAADIRHHPVRPALLPLTCIQEQIWLLSQLDYAGAVNNQVLASRLKGALDVRALEKSFSELVHRHEILRTHIVSIDGHGYQVVDPPGSFILQKLVLEEPEELREARMATVLEEEVRKPFDFALGLLRVLLVDVAADDHVLLIVMHHLISDGWSVGVLQKELGALYGAYLDDSSRAEGRDGPLPDLELQYGDFALWQQQWLQGEVLEKQLQYWRRQLAGMPTALHLPTDRPRPMTPSYRGASRTFQVPKRFVSGLVQLARREGATLFMVLLAALQIVLGRWSNQEDVVLGTPIAGRNHRKTEGLIGAFINNLVMRTDLSGDPTFVELLERVREVALGAYAHQEVPFERLAMELQPQRDLSRSPLYQVELSSQSFQHEALSTTLELRHLEVQDYPVGRKPVPFDISWYVWESTAGLEGLIYYATDLFDDPTIEHLADSYQVLLEAVAECATRPISTLPLMSERRRHRVLIEWNATRREYPHDRCVHELFEAQVSRNPIATAVVGEEQSLTYEQLDQRANQLAHCLREHGVGPEVVVGACMERSLDLVVGLLGILKAGGAYLPLDPSLPQRRLELMLADSGARVLLVHGQFTPELSGYGWARLRLDEEESRLSRYCVEPPCTAVRPDNLAYVIYTSGSTGEPKGVAAVHAAVVNRVSAQEAIAPFAQAEVCCQKTAIGFVDAVAETWVPLLSGQVLVVASESVGRDAQVLSGLIEQRGVTRVVTVPSLARAWLEDERNMPRLRGLLNWTLSGETLDAQLLEQLKSHLPRCRFINLYGSSEVAADATCYIAGDERVVGEEGVPIGGPIANTQVYVLDEHLEPVPIGAEGEIYVGGVPVARGYLGRGGLTAERFVPDPFGEPGSRLYRSGDRGRYRTDGRLQYRGRRDDQVKVRGFRIELGEVQEQLSRHPQVREALVVARTDPEGQNQLVAYVAQTDSLSPSGLREYLEQHLPQYMIPGAFVFLERLPLNASGKVDRHSLPAPAVPVSGQGQYVSPSTPTEEVLAQIWAEVLRLDQVGVQDNFFELGGHSLLATRVMARVRESFAVELPLRVMFEATVTVRALGRQIEQKRRESQGLGVPDLKSRGPGIERMPLSFTQERLWFLEQLEELGGTYNESMALRIEGVLQEAVLERSFAELVRRHEILRTRIETTAEGKGEQVIEPAGGFRLGVLEVGERSETERTEALHRQVQEERARPFEFEQGLFRVLLLRVNAEEHVLVVTLHHIISDVWSLLGILRYELSVLYAAYVKGERSPLAELEVQYGDYALWQRQWLQGEVLERQLDYWRQQLSGMPAALELPTDRPRPPTPSYRGASCSLQVPKHCVAALSNLARQEGATLYMVLLAALQVVLGRWSNQEDVAVGSSIAGRTHRKTEGLIGFFINTLVMRTDLSGAPTFVELLGRVREMAFGAYAHQETPFEKLVADLQPERDLSRQALFQVMFTLQNMQLNELRLPGLALDVLTSEHTSSKFDLAVDLFESEAGLWGRMEYATDLFDEQTIERLVESYQVLLEAVTEDAARPISILPLMSESQRNQVLIGWNATRTEYPSDRCVHELFEEQVQRTPRALAVVYEGESLTYEALDRRANQLAHYLRERCIGPEGMVGVCMERSLELVVALLGIWKAGGAYLPLDPSLPERRLELMLSDSGARLLLVRDQKAPPLAEYGGVRVRLDQEGLTLARYGTEAPVVGVRSDNLAYAAYTSGSTGVPKAIAAVHTGLVNRLSAQARIAPFGESEVYCQKTAIGFIDSLTETLVPLLSGQRLLIAPEAVGRNPQSLAELIERGGVTRLITVPSLARAWLEDERNVARLQGLRSLTLSGEALSTELLERLRQQLPRCRFLNLYGSTEVAADATGYVADEDSRVGEEGVPIGAPIANARVYLLDEYLEPVPIGVEGEIYIGGVPVARGYLGRGGLTAERFVPDPFGEPGGRLYRSGDRGRYRADGRLQYRGRGDDQVKVRGFRIELGEVQEQLLRHPRVREALVMARPDAQGQKQLVAYVAQTGSLSVSGLREYLEQHLPRYMIPRAFVFLERLPLNVSGKVDRHSLPAPDQSAFITQGYEPPQGDVETQLAGIWQEILKVDRVGRHDNFFELGGNSLQTVMLNARLHSRGLHADVRKLFTTRSLTELALAVEQDRAPTSAVPANLIPNRHERITPDMLPLIQLQQEEIDRIVAAVPGGTANVQDIYPLAPLQEGILFHHLLNRDTDAYILQSLFTFDSRDQLDGFLLGLQAVIDRHDILRTSIAWEGLSEPVQVVWRRALLREKEIRFEGGSTDTLERLQGHPDILRHRLDLARAPLLAAYTSHDRSTDCWILLLLSHHIIMDNSTVQVLHQEIEAHRLGQGDRLPPAVPFRDFVARTRDSNSRAGHEKFFQKLLADVHEPTIPFGLTDVFGDGSELVEVQQTVDLEVGRKLLARARERGASPATVFHLAWALVLRRVTGRDDVVFGTVLLGRMHAGGERVLGMFINTLPMRIQLGGRSAQDGVREVHELLGQLMEHEHASLVLAQRCSAVVAPAPLFTAVLNYRHRTEAVSGTEQFTDGIRFLGIAERSNYPILFSVDDYGDVFRLKAQVRGSLDARRTCQLMHRALEQLVEALENALPLALCDLDVLPENERRKLLIEWNATRREYPHDRCLHELFEDQVKRHPGAPAVVYEEQSLTYEELDGRANQLAHYLREQGVRPEVVVGVCVERSLDLVVGLLGILKAGGAYLPLDPSYPEKRLQLMLSNSNARVLLVNGQFSPELRGYNGLRVRLDEEESRLSRYSVESPCTMVRPDNLAYVIYTSGSTGRPKAVAAVHAAVVNRVKAQEEIAPFTDTEVCCQKTAIGFVDAVAETLVPLLSGQVLVVASESVGRDAQVLSGLVEQRGVTRLVTVPSLARAWLEDERNMPRLKGLRSWTLSGEALSTELLERLRGQLPQCRFINLYGSSEVAADATCYVTADDDVVGEEGVPIGSPIANARVYVLDEYLEPVPIGAEGEIYIGGVPVARGYLGRGGLTAERFVPDPFGEPGGRLYRSGDRGRYRADGKLQYRGRGDDQVKVRGFRIELGEVQEQLSRHPQVREALVMVRPDAEGQNQLVAYVAQAGSLSVTQLREHLEQHLPQYMIPGAFVLLERLPLNASGKVDRHSLPAPEVSVSGEGQYVSPSTPTEEVLAQIWAEVLLLDQVGVQDNFFELGGHSLLATRVMARVRESFAVELPLRIMFEATVTLRTLGRQIEQARREQQGLSVPDLQSRGPGIERVPLSFTQERLWFLEQMEELGSTYNESLALRVQGELQEPVLERSFAELVRRHEILRTRIETTAEGKGEQVIEPAGGFRLRVLEVGGQSAAGRAEALRLGVQEEARRPFELERELFRVVVRRVSAQEHVLVITLHHIISDVWSLLGVLRHEVSVLYAAYVKGESSPLAELEVQYGDFALWQRQWLQGQVLERQLDYWRQQLSGMPAALELPSDRPRSATPSFRGARQSFQIPRSCLEKLTGLARKENVTLYIVLLAALQVVLGRWSNQEDVVVGSPIAGRTHRKTEGLIGFFINTLLMRTDLSGDPTFVELLARVRRVAFGAYAHQEVPFEKLVAELQPERDLSRQALFQVMFTLQNMRLSELQLSGLVLEYMEQEAGGSKFDLAIDVFEDEAGLWGRAEYATDLFDAQTIERLVESYQVLLESVAEDAQWPISTLPLMSERQQDRVLIGWNATRTDYPQDRCVQELFEAQVRRTPGATAVVYEGESVTYEELDRRANQVAHTLRRHGVGPEKVVGLFMERSLELVAGFLGILKAGGAYVSLDPTYPPERLSYMLTDSGAKVLLTRGELPAPLTVIATELSTQVIRLDPQAPDLQRCSTAPAIEHTGPDQLLYILYTSGSTGRPKGVMGTHRCVLNRLAWDPGTEDEVYAHKTTLNFIDSLWELLMPLTRGQRVVIIAQDAVRNPTQLVETLAVGGVTRIVLVPSLLRVLLESDIALQARLPKLRHWACSGEPLAPDLAELFRVRLPQARLLNIYGTSEFWDATFHAVEAPAQAPVPIGHLLPNMRAYVLDRALAPLPVGLVGELYITGDGLARGYIGRPELTAERFIASPFAGGERLYRTGDRVRWREDGTLLFAGRADDQVKIRGYRIELGEIQAQLLNHPGVRDAVVIARGQGEQGRQLVAYIESAPELALDSRELRAYLERRLPKYMVPAAYVLLEQLPLSANGKIDRQRLPAPAESEKTTHSYEPPRNELEGQLAQMWRELLDIERVGRHDNFFELGGESVLAIRLALRANAAMIKLTVRDIFEFSTLAELAAYAGRQTMGTQPTRADEDAPVTEIPFPPDFARFLERWPGYFDRHVIVLGLECHVPLPAENLETALRHLVAKHESLRLSVTRQGSDWTQRVVAAHLLAPVGLVDHADFSAVDAAACEQELERSALELAATVNVTTPPLLRARLCERGGGVRQRLLIAIHHAAIDVLSMTTFIVDLQRICVQLARDQALPEPVTDSSFRQRMAQLSTYGHSPRAQQQIPYWSRVLSDARAMQVFGDTRAAASTAQPGDGGRTSIGVELSTAATRALVELAPRALKLQLDELLLTALSRALGGWSQRDAITIQLVRNGRVPLSSNLDISDAVGWFVTYVPIRLDTQGQLELPQVLESTRAQLRAIPDEGMAYGVLRHMNREPALTGLPEPRIFLNHAGNMSGRVSNGNGVLSDGEPGGLFSWVKMAAALTLPPMGVDALDVGSRIWNGRLHMSWSYESRFYEKPKIQQLAVQVVEVLQVIAGLAESTVYDARH